MTWTVSLGFESCGSCGDKIPADAPMQTFHSGRMRRCVRCAHGPVNVGQVASERERISACQSAGKNAAVPVPPMQYKPVPGFTPVAALAGSVFDDESSSRALASRERR